MTNIFKKIILFTVLSLLLGSCANKPKETFGIGDKTFLLNEKPFVIKAAEIHYTRIPKEYWEHRIQMCKALGMNTICIYVFWNIHEQKEGEFDFTGQNDIAEFCRMAQDNGMYIMVRPGPYVCSEWEMGGLPWWLLKKKDIKVRSNDPYFLDRTKIFMNKVGEQLADMQITRGGNIIMVQVENEYSSYATDKEYIANIRDIVKGAGFETDLFQCDWSSNFMNNALDDLLWTINFGVGANIDKQFEKLEEMRPTTPLMCSEYWSGWFDHWGRPHETRESKALVEGMKQMLDRGISFSLYMTHGGTTFGHWGGANSPSYSAMCSSYDYDAPISEAGWATPKYHDVRNLLEGYLQPGEKLSDIPNENPVIEIDKFTLEEVAPLFENLPKPITSENIEPMEYFDQGWGSILYRTQMKETKANSTLIINEAHDWAQVFIDGKRVAVLDRRRGEKTVTLKEPVKAGAVLDILVEAMGRVNFGIAIHDRKGITDNVLLACDGDTTDLKQWQVYNFPVDHKFVSDKKFVKQPKPDMPSYYKGTFEIDKVGDVFLDMSTWGKGMVWVNGYAIGRFWKIGPQQTLYMPGCWLKKGKNEIIVLDIDSPQEAVIKGLTKPILDVLRVDKSLLNRKDGETLDLSDNDVFDSGSMKSGNGWQNITFKNNKKCRYFCLEVKNSHEGSSHAAIAELYVLNDKGKRMPREKWGIYYADSEEILRANNGADKVFDLQESTFWHTEYSVNSPSYPHYLVIDLGEDCVVGGFSYLPRAEASAPGMIKDYSVYLSETPFKK